MSISQEVEQGRVETAGLCSAISEASAKDSEGWGLRSSDIPVTCLVVDAGCRQEASVHLLVFSLSELVRTSSHILAGILEPASPERKR